MRLSSSETSKRAVEHKRQRQREVDDLTGRKFNGLTVVSRADDYINPSGNRFVQWNCRCDCGKMVVKRGTALRNGTAKSCGCWRSKSNQGKGLIDLTGKIFGTRTVIGRAPDFVDSRGKHWPMWECECECGKHGIIDGARLRNGTERLCSCQLPVVAPKVRKRKKASKPRRVSVPIPANLQAQMVNDEDKCLSANSHKKVRWRCEHGHEWDAVITSRTRSGSGCPYCSGRLPVPGVNDLATLRPDIAATLVDPSLATTVGVGSAKKLQWQCDVDPMHIWVAEVRARCGTNRQSGTGCPHCANRGERSDKRLPDAVDVDNTLRAEAVDPEALEGLSAGSGVKVQWKCDNGGVPHTYWMSVRKKVKGQGCPVCAGKIVVPGVNDLATTEPGLADELVDESMAHAVSRGSERMLEWQCDQGHRWKATVYSRVAGQGCPVCANSGTSKMEEAVYQVLADLVGEDKIIRHDQSILPGRYELDFVIPDAKVAVEFNGLYWHSVDAGKDPMYHRRKWQQVSEAGYQLVQIWEDDWVNRRGVCVALLAAKLGCVQGRRLFARKLVVEQVSGVEAGLFMDANHIQGRCNAQWHWGLRDGDELVAVVSVRKSRDGVGVLEICRYATSCMVVGGFSKLLKAAERELLEDGEPLVRWISFSANDVSDGNLYATCGFKVLAENDPEYQYVGRFTDMQRTSKRSFQRKRFRDDPKLLWDDSWTEREAARRNGLLRVYDSGKVKWMKEVSQ